MKKYNRDIVFYTGGRRAGKADMMLKARLLTIGAIIITPEMMKDRPLLGVDINSRKHVSNVKYKK